MTVEQMLSEENLIRKCQSGDDEAFALLVQKHSADAYRTAYMMLRDHSGSEDVVQDAFLVCYRKLHTFRLDSSFKTWFYRIVVNLCYDRLRKQGRESTAHNKLSRQTRNEANEMSELENRLDLKEIISSMGPEHRLVLTLYYSMDLEVKKIAGILGIPVGTVKSRLNAARNLLKKRLERGQEYAL